MKTYDLAYLIPVNLSEEETQNLCQKVITFIKEENGEISAESTPVKRKLAFAIKNQRQAYFVALSLGLNPENSDNLRKKLKLENQILRFLISKKPAPSAVRERRERTLRRPLPPRQIIQSQQKTGLKEEEKDKKVEMKDIEKKLAEILGDI